MTEHNIVIGSRGSRLAVIQSEMVRDFIREKKPGCQVEILTMKTTGDKILDRTLEKIGGKGLFVKELDKALRDGCSDLSVHILIAPLAFSRISRSLFLISKNSDSLYNAAFTLPLLRQLCSLL